MFIIGISGVTNGGKTSISKLILNHFPDSIYICQDSYFYTKDSGHLEYKHELKSHNYDSIGAIDSEKFLNELDIIIKKNIDSKFILLDGFMIFDFDQIKFDKKYFFTLPKEACMQMRLKRGNSFLLSSITRFNNLELNFK